MITFTFIFLEIFFSSLFATSNAISFSLVPLYPTAPGSLPPCPASIIIVLNSHFSFSLLRSTVLIVFWSSKFEVNLISSFLYLKDEGPHLLDTKMMKLDLPQILKTKKQLKQ